MILIEMDGIWGPPLGLAVVTADGKYLGAVTHAGSVEWPRET